MTTELKIATYLKCIRCGGPVTRKDSTEALFACGGDTSSPHPKYMISSKFDTLEGKIPEGKFIDWEKLGKTTKTK